LNVSIDVADDGIEDYFYEGQLNSTEVVDLNLLTINTYLNACTPDAEGNCLIPINISTEAKGRVILNFLSIFFI